MGGIFQLFRTLEAVLPHQVVIGIVVVVLIVGAPGWLHNIRSRQIRGAVRRWAKARGEADRAPFEAEVFRLAGGQARRLIVVAEEALRLNQFPLADRALAEVDRAGTHAAEARALRDAMRPPKPPPVTHPLEAVITARRLLDEGLVESARTQLAAARARFPDDPDLAELARRADEAAAPAAAG